MRRAALVGGGGHARVVAAVARRTGRFSLLGYTAPADEGNVAGLGWLGADDILAGLVSTGELDCAIPAVGMLGTHSDLTGLHARLDTLGITAASVVSHVASVHDDTTLGAGSVVLDGAVVNPGARLGRGCIINSHATVEHDCRIGDFCHLAPAAVLCGDARLGEQVFIGANACVLQGVTIPADTVIGAGATVTHSLDRSGTYTGTPARRLDKP